MSETALYFLCIGGGILLLVLQFLFAREFVHTAMLKGYPCESMASCKYFWYCFLFGIIGYLMVIALPVQAQREQLPVSSDELPEL